MIPHDEMEPREKRWLVEVEYAVRGTIEVRAHDSQAAQTAASLLCLQRCRSQLPPRKVDFDFGDLRFEQSVGAQECDENGIVFDPPEVTP